MTVGPRDRRAFVRIGAQSVNDCVSTAGVKNNVLEHLTNKELIDHVLSSPSPTGEETELVERLQAAIEEVERLTTLVFRQEVPVGADA